MGVRWAKHASRHAIRRRWTRGAGVWGVRSISLDVGIVIRHLIAIQCQSRTMSRCSESLRSYPESKTDLSSYHMAVRLRFFFVLLARRCCADNTPCLRSRARTRTMYKCKTSARRVCSTTLLDPVQLQRTNTRWDCLGTAAARSQILVQQSTPAGQRPRTSN